MEGELLTKKEVAAILKVTTRTINRYVNSGILTPVRISGKVVRFKSQEVDRLILECGQREV